MSANSDLSLFDSTLRCFLCPTFCMLPPVRCDRICLSPGAPIVRADPRKIYVSIWQPQEFLSVLQMFFLTFRTLHKAQSGSCFHELPNLLNESRNYVLMI